jgi:hypothetical protein
MPTVIISKTPKQLRKKEQKHEGDRFSVMPTVIISKTPKQPRKNEQKHEGDRISVMSTLITSQRPLTFWFIQLVIETHHSERRQ